MFQFYMESGFVKLLGLNVDDIMSSQNGAGQTLLRASPNTSVCCLRRVVIYIANCWEGCCVRQGSRETGRESDPLGFVESGGMVNCCREREGGFQREERPNQVRKRVTAYRLVHA